MIRIKATITELLLEVLVMSILCKPLSYKKIYKCTAEGESSANLPCNKIIINNIKTRRAIVHLVSSSCRIIRFFSIMVLLLTLSINVILLPPPRTSPNLLSSSLSQYIQRAMAQEGETSASTPPSNNTAGSQLAEGNDYLTYENSTYGIKISYPSTWQLVNVTNANDSRFIKIIAFNSPDESAGIGVWTDNSPGNETIDTYLAEDIQNYRQNPDYPNFTLISSDTKNTMFAGIPGFGLLFSYADNDTMRLSKETGTILGDKAYSIVYDSVLSQYSLNEPVLNTMLDSLVINVQKPNLSDISTPTSNNATTSQRSSTSEIIPEI
jgi:hypothetical protein